MKLSMMFLPGITTIGLTNQLWHYQFKFFDKNLSHNLEIDIA
jgi:hypothetical protein